MAGKIDMGEVFNLVGDTASGIGGALGDAPSPSPAVPSAGLDIGAALLGALVGGVAAYATKSNVAVGAGLGGALALLLPSLGISPISMGPGGV